jgi:PadR family transcriptional regulator, regulatory protein PadR
MLVLTFGNNCMKSKPEVLQGTLYPALLRLEQHGWIRSEWGVSDNNRKAKYYALTKSGRKQLLEETVDWQRMSAIINRLLKTAE